MYICMFVNAFLNNRGRKVKLTATKGEPFSKESGRLGLLKLFAEIFAPKLSRIQSNAVPK